MPPDLTLHLDIAKSQRLYFASLQGLLDGYAACVAALSILDAKTYDGFSPFFHFAPAVDKRLPHDAAADTARDWLLQAVIRDAIERTNALLEEYRLLCAVYSKSSDGLITGEAVNRIRGPERKAFHRLGLPEKLAQLRDVYGVETQLAESVVSINRLRNCLVHRLGVVSERDANAPEGMVVRFHTLQAVAVAPDGSERLVTETEALVPAGWRIGLRASDSVRTFKHGERVAVTYREVADAIWTLTSFSRSLGQAVDKYGETRGFKVQG